MKNLTLFLSVISLVFSLKIDAQNSITQSIPPQANFSVSSTTICAGESVQFTDMSAGAPTAWKWNFIGGTPTTSTLQNPVVTYTVAGKYGVSLMASNQDGFDNDGKLNLITVEVCSGIQNHLPETSLEVFPNPVHTYLNLTCGHDSKFTLFNSLGNELMSGQLVANETCIINFEKYPSGIYFLQSTQGSKLIATKVIKN